MVSQAQPALAGNGTGHWWPSKYGPDDQAGALNDITPRKVIEAARLVRRGRVYDLAHVLHQDIPAFPAAYIPAVPDHQLPPDQPALRISHFPDPQI